MLVERDENLFAIEWVVKQFALNAALGIYRVSSRRNARNRQNPPPNIAPSAMWITLVLCAEIGNEM